ncbi:glycogen synthase [candidate division WWE3 bacterium]|nr:glycogen synthase [candidate division WWE3 bacterium]
MKDLSKIYNFKSTPLKILIIGVECYPYASVGGFGRVIESLSQALLRLGHDVRVFMPKFGFLDENKYKTTMVVEGLKVPTGDEGTSELICNVKMLKPASGPTTYFLENMEYYEKRANVYNYSDDPTRWALLSRGAIEFVRFLNSPQGQKLGFSPDLLHLNDWHTGILPNYLKTVYKNDPFVNNVATLFTIHNLQIQGILDYNNVSELDFDDGKSEILNFFSENLPKQNFMRRGIIYSDAINTVSPTYSREILEEAHGAGLNKLLLEVRSKLYGVLNGLNYDDLDPATDKLIEKNYDVFSLEDRGANKTALQKEFDLAVASEVPVLGYVGRLDHQKGVDLIVEAMKHLIKDFGVQFVEVGGGDVNLVGRLKELKDKYPKNVGIHPLPNSTLPRLVFSGCDMIVYPSRFEPCGVVQLEAMRYGAVPVVRKVGGLADTVENFDPKTMTGTGFVFEDFDLVSFYGQLVRAVETYRHKNVWKAIQKNGMRKDFSWKNSASEYVRIYKRAVEFHKKQMVPEDAQQSVYME